MATNNNILTLDAMPTDYAYEDYLSALLMTKGRYYLERSIKKNTPGIGDELELDIVLNKYDNINSSDKQFVEIKSKGWGLIDIFKVRGWMDYMGFGKASFIVQQTNMKSFPIIQSIAQSLNIKLIDNPKVNDRLDDKRIISEMSLDVPDVDSSINTAIRFSLHLERAMSDYLNRMKKSVNGLGHESYERLHDYWENLNNNPFFVDNLDKRIKSIFDCWVDNKNFTARVDHELNGEGWLSADKCPNLIDGHYIDLYYNNKDISPVVIAMYVELLCRIAILKACVDELTEPKQTPQTIIEKWLRQLDKMSLPSNISYGLEELKKQPYFHLYPRFWQIFIYAFGGFVLLDKENEEYELLSRLSGIPIGHIQEAFGAFDLLFHSNKGWMKVYDKTNIRMLAMMPPPFLGIGANMRRFLYRAGDSDDLATFENLGKIVTGQYTLQNLFHWNSVAYEYLKKDKTLIHNSN